MRTFLEHLHLEGALDEAERVARRARVRARVVGRHIVQAVGVAVAQPAVLADARPPGDLNT